MRVTASILTALALAATATLGVSARADAPATPGAMIMLPGESAIQWSQSPPSLPHNTRISVLSGDPAKPGPFVLRLTVPADTVIAPHTHNTPESLTVLSGLIWHDMGKTIDKARGQEMSTGGFVFLPADMPHSLWTASAPAVIEVSGTGPFGLNYINPADDPSTTH